MNHITALITSLGDCVVADIENPTLEFRRLKLLWQLVLGIDEYSNSSETLVVNNTTFVLLSSEKELGNAKFSRLEVETLDRQSGMQDDASLLIGVLNKVRKTVYLHADIVSNSSFEHYIASLLAKDLELAIDDDKEIDTNFDSQDETLKDCYKRGSAMLLMTFDQNNSKDHLLRLLMSSSADIVNSYLRAKKLSFIIEMDTIIDYHQQIINVMKYVFRKHTGYAELISNFFTENPIFPLLSQTNETTLLLKKLDIPLLLNIITQVCQAEKEEITELPITMEFMPQILKYYVDSLTQEGYSNSEIEEDFYIKMIKTCTIKWVDSIFDTKEYLKQLIDLSLVPSAMPYSFHGISLPNIHMRRALYNLKEVIRLKDVYFNGWLQRSQELPVLSEAELMWNLKITKHKWKVMKDEYQVIKQNCRLADVRYTEAIICKYLSVWVGKIGRLNEMAVVFSKTGLRNCWEKWRLKILELQKKQVSISKIMSVNKLKVYFGKWQKAKEQQFNDRQLKFQVLQKIRFFNIWSLKTSKKHELQKLSHQIYEKNCKVLHFNIWKKMSETSLSRLHKLNALEKRLNQQKIFDILQQKNNLSKILRTAVTKRNVLMAKWIFSYWSNISKLKKQGTDFNKKSNDLIQANTFNRWKRQHELNKAADNKYETQRIVKVVYIWRLRLREKQFVTRKDEANLRKKLKCWKLNTLLLKSTHQKDLKLKAIVLEKWKTSIENYVYLKNKSDELRILYLKRLYYTIWKSYNKLVMELGKRESVFKNRDQSYKSVLKKYLSTWRLVAYKSQIRTEDLEKRKNILNKGKLIKFFDAWKEKYAAWDNSRLKAVEIYQKAILKSILGDWLHKYDNILENLEKLQILQDNTDVSNIKAIVSKWAMKMIKIRNDERKCQEFIARWDRNRKRTFLELWRMRPSFNMDMSPFDDVSAISTPTPTEKIAAFTPRRTPRIQKSEASLLQSVERVRRRELAERLERYKIKY